MNVEVFPVWIQRFQHQEERPLPGDRLTDRTNEVVPQICICGNKFNTLFADRALAVGLQKSFHDLLRFSQLVMERRIADRLMKPVISDRETERWINEK